ncbi:MAG: hypothetical protein JW734_08610 [Candidatus Omnitrophica bacterium]|nr:hypothetical protein [Candidatus Omnitrophota bacterium]
MKRLCAEKGCDIVFIRQCYFMEGALKVNSHYKPLFPFIDICDLYKQNAEIPGDCFYDSHHPSKLGHRLIAEELSKRVSEIF